MSNRRAEIVVNLIASSAAVILLWSEYGWKPAVAAWCLGVWIRPGRRVR